MAVDWRGSRPSLYTRDLPVTRELVDRMRGLGLCFLRKVDASCPMDDDLISHILERD